MRLMHSKTLVFHEFYGDFPPYAILSHTWAEDEVTFTDMTRGSARSKKGFQKIHYCAEQAQQDGYDYIWVDTCNIDKTSSAELSEAINSMYQWYKHSQVCYAYLTDVQYLAMASLEAEGSDFRKSRWFGRGWTLQELLAPSNVRFYSSDWKYMGTLRGSRMSLLIREIRGIPQIYLSGQHLDNVSVAKKMSWASRRSTTRIEDTAYCLLGIFNVNMPLPYGEGTRAFVRLQEEIMKVSEDRSIFVWVDSNPRDPVKPYEKWYNTTRYHGSLAAMNVYQTGLLALSPTCYVLDVANEVSLNGNNIFTEPYFMTNKGLCITVQMYCLDPLNDVFVATLASAPFGREYMAILRCISITQKRFSRILTTTIIQDYLSTRSTKLFRPQKIYVAPGNHLQYESGVAEISLECRVKLPITDIVRTNVTASDVNHWAFGVNESKPKDRQDLPLIPGEACVVSYFIAKCQFQFRVLIRCTRGGRSLISVEIDTGVPPEELLTYWKLSGWADIDPKSSNMNTMELEEYLDLPGKTSALSGLQRKKYRLHITGYMVSKARKGGVESIRYCLELNPESYEDKGKER